MVATRHDSPLRIVRNRHLSATLNSHRAIILFSSAKLKLILIKKFVFRAKEIFIKGQAIAKEHEEA